MNLDDLYLAVLLGARVRGVRLRVPLRAGESLQAQRDVQAVVQPGLPPDPTRLLGLIMGIRSQPPPDALLRGLVATITDRYYGLQSLALASLVERGELTSALTSTLVPISPDVNTAEDRLALVRLWLNQWTRPGIWFAVVVADRWRREITQRQV
jgi:hypothetical protein